MCLGLALQGTYRGVGLHALRFFLFESKEERTFCYLLSYTGSPLDLSH